MTWIDYVDEDDSSVQEFTDWLLSLQHFARNDLIARMEARQAIAARGELVLPTDLRVRGELDAIRADPDLFELRWTMLSKQVRQYHAEPVSHPDSLVRLHLHMKADSGHFDPSAGARQEQEIQKAADRYHNGAADDWGS